MVRNKLVSMQDCLNQQVAFKQKLGYADINVKSFNSCIILCAF